MTHKTHSIAFSTGIKDENIKFKKIGVLVKKAKGIESICYFGTLSYKPECCSNCGKTSENFNIIKYGVKTSRITLNRTDNHPSFIFSDSTTHLNH